MNNLITRAWLGLIFLTIAISLLLVVPAGTVHYREAWAYLVIFLGDLMKKDPALLKRRLSAGPAAEKERTQKIIMLFASMGFIALVPVPALCRAMEEIGELDLLTTHPARLAPCKAY